MISDLGYAVRQLTKSPGFTAVAILTLALCIGANSSIFSVVHAILLKPYPWPQSEQLVYVYNTYPLMGLENAGSSIPDYQDRRDGVAGFSDSALYRGVSFNLAAEGTTPEHVVGLVATPSLFSTLKTGAALGRVFTEEDAQPGRDDVVVLSDSLWKNRFGADRDLVGKTIRLNSRPVTVIGVMSENFYFPAPRTELWVPFTFTPQQRSDDERGNEYSTMIARLKPSATLDVVQRELDSIQAQNAERLARSREFWKNAGFGGRVVGFLEQNVGEVRSMLWLVQAGVAAALLIGCANIASLLLSRALAREREFAIRVALGAGRGRLVRLLLTETVVLFLVGGGLGLVVALWGVSALESVGLSSLPRGFSVELDFTVFAFTLLCALIAGLAFGALPAWSASRSDTVTALKEAGSRTTAGRRTQRLRTVLVVSEIALALMLLSTAGLLVKSFERLQSENPGFAPEGVITAKLNLPANKYDRPEKRVAFHDAVAAELTALPGVSAVGFTNSLPFSGNNQQGSYSSPDIVLPAGAPLPHAQVREVDAGYLRALGLTLLRGRWFTDADRAETLNVCVVDRLLVERYWPGQDGLGKRIQKGGIEWLIVGVVAPVKIRNLEETTSKETIYFPYAQSPGEALVLVVRTSQDPGPLASAVREAVLRADPEQPVFDIKTMSQRMDAAAQPRRAPMILLSVFSAIALLLAALGVYGVLAFSVTQRTVEFGIRAALGATPRNIVALVLTQGTRLVIGGIIVGMAGYVALSRIIAQQLHGISAVDPATLMIAPIVLFLTALVASLLPARRATRVAPVVALRAE